MKKQIGILGLTMAIFLVGCGTVPITGRKQVSLVKNSEVNALALTNYKDFLSSAEVVTTGKQAEQVNRVGKAITEAVDQYFADNNYPQLQEEFSAWEYHLVNDNQVNAWCMPGGKIVVYSGLLNVATTDAELAAVMGHEVAHAVAHHGQERMSQEMVAQYGAVAVQTGFSTLVANNTAAMQELLNQAVGTGTELSILAYSRKHELEADHLGIIFMAMAGYDPEASIPFWEKMAQASAGAEKPSELLSTHPSDAKRIAAIKSELPEALEYYKPKE